MYPTHQQAANEVTSMNRVPHPLPQKDPTIEPIAITATSAMTAPTPQHSP
jgi:hypothetical protein